MSSHVKTILIWFVVITALVVGYRIFDAEARNSKRLLQSDFYRKVAEGKILEVTVTGDEVGYEIRGLRKPDGSGARSANVPFTTYIVQDANLLAELQAQGIKVKAEPPRNTSFLTTLLMWSPMFLFIGVWIFFMRQMQSGGNRALSFGKSRAKLTSSQGRKVTFKDVAGVEEAKEELQEIIEFLKEPQKFQKLGGKIPKGVLLMGPPGTGKTLLARAIAGEASVPFFSISGSDFVEMFVGVGASRVRDLFEQGKKNAPCIVFIDEIDAVGRHRGAGLGGGHDEREQTLNQLLVEMDGFETNEGVILIAATNRPDVLDPALLRPGRFDRQVVVGRPDLRGREEILKVHMRKIAADATVDATVIARSTPGFSGADLANLVNEAALAAARLGRKSVLQTDFEVAKDKVLMGAERKSMIISDEEKHATAYHEAGHALVALKVPHGDPVHKVTIIPRGQALGVTQTLPVDDRHTHSKQYLESTIAMLMGGRAAEELRLNRLTTGASNDFERVTELARKMVTEWGMSEKMGPLTFGKQEEQIFIGREISQRRDYSEATAVGIDSEVRRIVMHGYETAKRILVDNAEALTTIAEALLERESIDASDIELLLKGEPLPELSTQLPEPDTDDVTPAAAKTAKPTSDSPAVLPKPDEQPA